MQSIQPGDGLGSKRAWHKSRLISGRFLPNWRLALKSSMWSGHVVKYQILFQQLVDVRRADRDDVAQQFFGQRPVKPFHHRILPRTTHTAANDFDAHVVIRSVAASSG